MSLLGSSKYVALNAYTKDVAALQRHGESGAMAIYNNPLYNNVAKFMHNWSEAYNAGDADKANELINSPMGVFMSQADNAGGAWQVWRSNALTATNQLMLNKQKEANEAQIAQQQQELAAKSDQQQQETIKNQQTAKYYHQQNAKSSSILSDKNSSGSSVNNSLGAKDSYFNDDEIEEWY